MAAVITSPLEFNVDDLYVDLEPSTGYAIALKVEGFNFGGSIKLKAATEMVEAREREGVLTPGDTLIESSSGNMGVALSVVAASRGYGFVCVTDDRCTTNARRLMETLGSTVHVVADRGGAGGLLAARLDRVRDLCATHEGYVWLNQYANPGNWGAHYRTTGPEIAKAFPDLDVLFIGAGTTGTLMGCARYFRDHQPSVRIVAIDSVGSVTFGGEPAPRLIPGLGTSVRPAILDETYVHEVIRVSEGDTVAMCHQLVRHGFVFGGSTGTVVHGAVQWMRRHGSADLTTVAIAPDFGTGYLDTVYHAAWLREAYT
ncbi:2,3-diaminopropionate biosynthesis protein SbnA [Actinoplanes auranticolor]|uniref:2,3-diaminopropionate biosynthesis protein SbnA n=1 Tax=Actinoplanes auranticolor TaxID=47988 RepID=A0A919SW47_9ACTN|nr:2,3-diaminopropionate biosynthesis protein SbnA [Actinoplanes auranticolor]GIM79094.1 2,3-diaminopropionate biosynthesis protein SbnA [Actinoplanes auranticolor]